MDGASLFPGVPLRRTLSRLMSAGLLMATLTSCAASISGEAVCQLSGWHDDDHAAALRAFRKSCVVWAARQRWDEPAQAGGGTASGWKAACEAAGRVPEERQAARRFFESWFTVTSIAGEGNFTGYYESLVKGSWKPSKRYTVPIYRRPSLAPGQDMPTRAEIARGALQGQELLWIDDPIDALFLELQGSGRVQMPDGRILAVGYAGQNGYAPYFITRALADHGVAPLSKLSHDFIRQWARKNPARARELIEMNLSMVFFQMRDGDSAIGAMGASLTPGRSLAVDPRHIPLGVPLWLETDSVPATGPLRRTVVAQDTGGAIKGRVRGDLFWGFGAAADAIAPRFSTRGRYSLLVARSTPAEPGCRTGDLVAMVR